MKLVAGVAIVLLGCASGGKAFEPPDPDPQPDAPKPPQDSQPEIPTDTTVAPPPDSNITPPPDTNPPPDSPPAPCVAIVIERLGNPALDLVPNTAWVEVPIPGLPGGPYPIIGSGGAVPVSAPNNAWLGGAAGEDADPMQGSLSDQLYQDVTFPADATDFVVSGMFAVAGVEDTDAVYDRFTLDIIETNGTQIENILQLTNMTPAAGFASFSKTLTTNLAGRTVRLRATSTNDEINHTNFFLDSLSFKATSCP